MPSSSEDDDVYESCSSEYGDSDFDCPDSESGMDMEAREGDDKDERKRKEQNNRQRGYEKQQKRKTPQQWIILLEAYEKNPLLPAKGDARLSELCSKTGLQPEEVRNWFNTRRKKLIFGRKGTVDNGKTKIKANGIEWERKKEILFASFEKDPSCPTSGSVRMRGLKAVTGLDRQRIVNWFRNERGKNDLKPTKKLVKKTSEQEEILTLAYVKDPSIPLKGSTRLNVLSEATSLAPITVQRWFKHRHLRASKLSTEKGRKAAAEKEEWEAQKKVLLASYSKDSRTPTAGSDRMKKMLSATGLSVGRIQMFFGRERRKHKENETKKAYNLAEDCNRAVAATAATQQKKAEDSTSAKQTIATVIESWETDKRPVLKRKNWTATEELCEKQNTMLRAYMKNSNRPTKHEPRLAELCAETGLDPSDVQLWFQNHLRTASLRAAKIEKEVSTPGCNICEVHEILLTGFEKDSSYPKKDSDHLFELCRSTGLDAVFVQDWFCRRLGLSSDNIAADEKVVPEKPEIDRKPYMSMAMKNLLRHTYDEDSTYPGQRTEYVKRLCTLTGLDSETIQMWWRRHRLRRATDDRKRAVKANLERTARNREILLAALEKDSSTLVKNSDRMKELCAATGLKDYSIQRYFNKRKQIMLNKKKNVTEEERKRAVEEKAEQAKKKRKILLDAFAKDSTTPLTKSARLRKLCTATGLKNHTIRCWFNKHRKCVNSGKVQHSELCDDKPFSPKAPQCAEKENELTIDIIKQEPSKDTNAETKKCPVCDRDCVVPVSIVSLKEARNMDKYFGSSLLHFLSYTCAVRVCVKHINQIRSRPNE